MELLFIHVVMKRTHTHVNKFNKLVVSYCLQAAIQRQSAVMPSYNGTRVLGASLLAIEVVPGINDMHCINIQPCVGEVSMHAQSQSTHTHVSLE